MTSKQRAYLRSLANTQPAILHIGKEGISDNLIKQAWDALEKRELIKGAVQKGAALDAREACEALAKALHAEPVQVIGSKFVLYRESREHKKIELPK